MNEINKEMCANCKCNDCDKEIQHNNNGQITNKKCTVNCDYCKRTQLICDGCFIKDGYNSGKPAVRIQFER